MMVERSLMMERPLLYRDSTGGGEVPLVLDREVLYGGPGRERSCGVERVVLFLMWREILVLVWREVLLVSWSGKEWFCLGTQPIYIGGAKCHYSRQRDHKMWVNIIQN